MNFLDMMMKCYLVTHSDMLQYQIFCLLVPWLLWRTQQATSLAIKKCPELQKQLPRRHNTNTVYRSASLWNDQNCCTILSLSRPWKNQRGSRGVAPLILNLSTKWRWVANFTSLLPDHFTTETQNTVAPARNQTLNYPAYSMVTIPPTVSQLLNVLCQFIPKTKQQHSNTQLCKCSTLPSQWTSTFKSYAQFLGSSPALADTINMCWCHFMTLHMQQKLDRLSSDWHF